MVENYHNIEVFALFDFLCLLLSSIEDFLANMAMMAIAFMRRPSVRPSLSLSSSAAASTIVEVFETIIATGLKSFEHV